jgi:hypothetical protein
MFYKGGHKAGKGTYWDTSTGRRLDIEREEVLPGDSKTVYAKVPSVAVILAGPLLGLIFALFLPFIGIAMAVTLIGKKAAGGVASIAARSVSFGWRPVEAYLAGKKKKAEARRKNNETK